MTRPEQFRKIAEEIASLYEKKDALYGDSFGCTYEKLGIISAVTRISDKYNRLCNLATNTEMDNLGESLEDTLKDMAAYCIMTLMKVSHKKESAKTMPSMNVNQYEGFKVGDTVREKISEIIERERTIEEIILYGPLVYFKFIDGSFFIIKEDKDLERLTIVRKRK